jgi:hypothetical protein
MVDDDLAMARSILVCLFVLWLACGDHLET